MDEDKKEDKKEDGNESKNEGKKIADILNIRNAIIISTVLILLSIGYVYRGVFVVAKVNGDFISRLSVVRELEKASGKNVLDTIIIKKLIADETLVRGVNISDEDISTAIKGIEDQLASQGQTIEGALSEQGMSMDNLRKDILVQKQLEAMIIDKVQVSEEDVDKYMSDYGVVPPEGQEDMFKQQVRSQLENEQYGVVSQAFIDELKAKANIRYFVEY